MRNRLLKNFAILMMGVGFSGYLNAQEFPALKGDYFGQTPPGDTPVVFARGIISDSYQQRGAPSFSDYLGQPLPGQTPVVFAPGIVSIDGRYEYGLTVSPDGDEIYFTAEEPGEGLTIVKLVEGKWTEPKTANLKGNHSWEFEAFFTWDGEKLFFTSDTNNLSKFWYMEKSKDGWGKPKYLNSPVNDSPGMWCTFTKDETMYYGNNSNFQIHRARLNNEKYAEIENLGFTGTHPYVAPDESYFLFNSGQYGGFGKSDILIVFRNQDGSWGMPVNLGGSINTTDGETCASLSPDGKYIFFSRYNEPGEKCNIYWASVDQLIESLRQANKH
jgi:Tol biopolymer transport system component